MADWLKDSLMIHEEGSSSFRKSKSLQEEQWRKWKTFHFSTRLKLEAADHFCRLALGAASMPVDSGLPLLALTQTEWYIDAFFFELKSAYDILLQELNVVYAINLDIGDVNWPSIKRKLPAALVNSMETEWEATWFKKLRWYRNTTTHHLCIPTEAKKDVWGEMPWECNNPKVWLSYIDTDSNERKHEEIKACADYLKKMIEHIHAVWTIMAEQFDWR